MSDEILTAVITKNCFLRSNAMWSDRNYLSVERAVFVLTEIKRRQKREISNYVTINLHLGVLMVLQCPLRCLKVIVRHKLTS
jgi:hypothetical protein